jgi:hypothetical protein
MRNASLLAVALMTSALLWGCGQRAEEPKKPAEAPSTAPATPTTPAPGAPAPAPGGTAPGAPGGTTAPGTAPAPTGK